MKMQTTRTITGAWLSETWALTIRELRKWLRTPALVLVSFIQPIVWLALFGNAFNPTNLVPTQIPGFPQLTRAQLDQIRQSILGTTFGGAANYITYLTGGILALILLFNSAFSGGSIVWDRRFGFLNMLLAAPIARTSIFLSRVVSTVVKGMSQALIIFFLALIVPGGLKLSSNFSALDLLGIFFVMFLLALCFSSLFTALAVRITKWETLIAVINLVNLPLLFASSALLPISSMPNWLRIVAGVNPISKAVETARLFIIQGALSTDQVSTVAFDLTYLAGFAIFFTVVGVVLSRLALRAE